MRKATEKSTNTCALTDASRTLASAAQEGFEWRTPSDAWAKVTEEVEEVRGAAIGVRGMGGPATQEELGDLLFAVVGLSRWLGVEPNAALRGAIEKFEARLGITRHLASGELSDKSGDELRRLWDEAKRVVA